MEKNVILGMAIVAGCAWITAYLNPAGLLNISGHEDLVNAIVVGVASILIINAIQKKGE